MEKKKARHGRSPTSSDVDIQPRSDPLYRKIFLALQAKILSGDFDQGRYLPSEYDLAKTFNVSRITAMRALNDLAAAGLVVRERGRGTRARIMSSGTIVRGPVAEPTRAFDHNPTVEQGRDRDYIAVLDLRQVVAPKEAAAALGIRPGRKIVRAIRILKFGGLPYAHVTTYLRPNLGLKWRRHDLERGPLARLIESEGINLVRTTEVISAIEADNKVALQLQVLTKAPVLQVVRTSFDIENTPTEFLIAVHPSDRYRYAVTSTFGLSLI
jgi:GntR family transcriptional regulator